MDVFSSRSHMACTSSGESSSCSKAGRANSNETGHEKELAVMAAWLLRAVTCIDLTTLSGDDTPSYVCRLCYKAKHPIREDLLQALKMHDKDLYEEIRQFRKACGDVHMKTILGTGELGSLTNVYKASLVAMMAGNFHIFGSGRVCNRLLLCGMLQFCIRQFLPWIH
ncbi:hypothetical protein Chor_009824 [Crotalus horridus]